MTALLLIAGILALVALLFVGRGILAWTAFAVLALAAWAWPGGIGVGWTVVAVLAAVVIGLFALRPLRRPVLGQALFSVMRKALPRMGETERVALEAGTVWWDRELFSGRPDWRRLLDFPMARLSEAEQAFMDGPVIELCGMLDDWQIGQDRALPEAVWAFLRGHRFFGMIIPEEYGGHGFSALGHSAVVTKLASRSVSCAVTVMVPNSLGPAELLLHYGTDAQRDYYLPRLARGEEIPCFALTGPEAGSDAAATQSTGVVQRGTYNGEEVLGIRLNWRKRYITLAPVATVIGLAFKLQDPERLLGGEEELGITCALVPANLPGVEIGDLHDPMGVPFANGPTVGNDVFVPLDAIIGGPERAGDGWRMLMESLAAGRSVSLPSLSVGAAELACRVVGAYATIREQFDTPIGRFEGVEEPLARIAAHAYFMNAARLVTCSAIDAGERPAVISAIVKTYLTEGMRDAINDAMDIRAGAAIQRGPRNVLARAYTAVPIGITVEGANILSRSMIIYGQGAIRCHPFIHAEMAAVTDNDSAAFDRAIFGHANHIVRNSVRALLLGLTGARVARSPVSGSTARYYRDLTRMSAAFAVASDVAMLTLGGKLKRREKVSGRLADALGWMYLASASLKRFEADGRRERDLPVVRFSCEHALFQIQHALRETFRNLPGVMPRIMRWVTFPLGQSYTPPDDRLGSATARGLLEDREERRHLTADIFVPPPDEEGLGYMESCLDQAVEAHQVETKLRDAVREGILDRAPGDELADAGLAAGVITEDERNTLRQAQFCQNEVIRVDAFDPETYRRLR